MDNNWKLEIYNFLTKAIVFLLYLFAFGLFISRKLVHNSTNFICLFGLIQLTFQLIIMKENPFKKFKDNPLNLPILFFAFALSLSFIMHPYNVELSSGVKILQHLLVFLFYYIVVSNLNNLNQIKRMIAIASISIFLAAIFGTYQHFILGMGRAPGFFNSLSFGGFLAIFTIFLITYGLWGKTKPIYRITIFIGTAYLGMNLLITGARGAWLGFLGGIFTLAWLKKDKRVLAFLLISCLLLFIFLPQTYVTRFKTIVDTKTMTSNLERIALWKSALLMYRDHFITGVGLNRFKEEYMTNYKQPSCPVYAHPHSNLFKFMAETGTVGLIAFIWLMASIIILFYRNYKQITNSQWRLFPLAALCSIIMFNIQGLTNVNYGGGANLGDSIHFFWFIIILNIVVVNIYKEKIQQSEITSSKQDTITV